MASLFINTGDDEFKPERIQDHLNVVLDAEAELAEVEQIAARFDLDKIVRFIGVLIKVLRSFGWLVPKQKPGDPAASAV